VAGQSTQPSLGKFELATCLKCIDAVVPPDAPRLLRGTATSSCMSNSLSARTFTNGVQGIQVHIEDAAERPAINDVVAASFAVVEEHRLGQKPKIFESLADVVVQRPTSAVALNG